MEIIPADYQNKSLGLKGAEKRFVANAKSNMQFGFLILNTNPAMYEKGERLHILICSGGVILLRFFNEMKKVNNFSIIMPDWIKTTFDNIVEIVSNKLLENTALVAEDGKLRFPINLVCVFPELKRKNVKASINEDLEAFISGHCWFDEELQRAEKDFSSLVNEFLATTITECANPTMAINEDNVNSIIARLTPEYVILRQAHIKDEDKKTSANGELLEVNKDDKAARALRLTDEQIKIVNWIRDERLILACAGSGKTSVLIGACINAAKCNTHKKFLITCYTKNLRNLIYWDIVQAGFNGSNIECCTFHALCYNLLKENGLNYDHNGEGSFDKWVEDVIANLRNGKIKDRYYGIFIDEVQEFQTEWYKLCYDLLENKESGNKLEEEEESRGGGESKEKEKSEDHLFVICGDKTQSLVNLQRHGQAPWQNAGDKYPKYNGKSRQIKTNYRNSIEINDYIGKFLECAQNYLSKIQSEEVEDPDMFLRGESKTHGPNVDIKYLEDKTNESEAGMVVDNIKRIHADGIPYDEIAIIMYNGYYPKVFPGWQKEYNLENTLKSLLKDEKNDIPFCQMSSSDNDDDRGSLYNGDESGVKMLKIESSLGLDFEAVIVCGLLPLGEFDNTKKPDWEALESNDELFQEHVQDVNLNVHRLYVACSRARNVLKILLPETGDNSIYMKMLEDAYESDV